MRMSFVFALLLGLLVAPLAAQDTPKADNPIAAAAEKLKASPDDRAALQSYLQAAMGEVVGLAQTKPDEAEKKFAEVQKTLADLKPTDDTAKATIAAMQTQLKRFGDQLAVQKLSLADIEKELDAKPDDAAVVGKYIQKLMMDLSMKARSEPAAASDALKAGKERLTKLQESTKDEAIKTQIEQSMRNFASIERQIEGAKKLAELVGKDAAPLEVEAWVNGAALTDADLKGKVVLLDFWAVWCGPCIATFPHLIEWNEQYGDKGLVIVGLTRYYNMTWDDTAGRATRSTEMVPAEKENEMLMKFAEHHKLHHRFAIQKKEGKMDDYYAVSGIPHVVVIDQEGKVRIVRVGSGPQNAKDISDMLAKLLGPASAAAPAAEAK